MPYVKSFNMLVWEKKVITVMKWAPLIRRPKSYWNFVVSFKEKSDNA